MILPKNIYFNNIFHFNLLLRVHFLRRYGSIRIGTTYTSEMCGKNNVDLFISTHKKWIIIFTHECLDVNSMIAHTLPKGHHV